MHSHDICPQDGTYDYTILACKFVNAGGVGLTNLVVRTALLVVMVENVKVVIIRVISGKNIGE